MNRRAFIQNSILALSALCLQFSGSKEEKVAEPPKIEAGVWYHVTMDGEAGFCRTELLNDDGTRMLVAEYKIEPWVDRNGFSTTDLPPRIGWTSNTNQYDPSQPLDFSA